MSSKTIHTQKYIICTLSKMLHFFVCLFLSLSNPDLLVNKLWKMWSFSININDERWNTCRICLWGHMYNFFHIKPELLKLQVKMISMKITAQVLQKYPGHIRMHQIVQNTTLHLLRSRSLIHSRSSSWSPAFPLSNLSYLRGSSPLPQPRIVNMTSRKPGELTVSMTEWSLKEHGTKLYWSQGDSQLWHPFPSQFTWCSDTTSLKIVFKIHLKSKHNNNISITYLHIQEHQQNIKRDLEKIWKKMSFR